MATEGEGVQFDFGADVSALLAQIGVANQALTGFTSQVEGMGAIFATVGAAIASAFSVQAIVDFVNAMSDLGQEAIQTSEKLGLTVAQVTAFQSIARGADVSTDGATQSMERLGLSAQKAADGVRIQLSAFNALGISQQFLRANLNNLDAIVDRVADSFAQAANGPQKTAIAMELMGRAGAQMIPILNGGSQALEEQRRQAEAFGVVLTDQVAEALNESNNKLHELNEATMGAGITLFQVMKPAIDSTVEGIRDLVVQFNKAMESSGLLRNALELVGFTFGTINIAIREVIALLYSFGQVVAIVIESAIKAIAALGQVVYDVFTADFEKAARDADNALADIEKSALNRLGNIQAAMLKLGEAVAKIWNMPGAPTSAAQGAGGGNAKLPPLAFGGGGNNDAAQIFAAKEREARQLTDIGIEAAKQEQLAKIEIAKDTARTEYELGRITKEQLLAVQGDFDQQTIAAEQEAIQLRMAALDEMIEHYKAKYGEASKEFTKFNAQAVVELAKLRAELDRLGLQAQVSAARIGNAITVEVSRPMQQAVSTITQGFGTAFQGLLTRTMTWAQAFRTIINSMLQAFTAFVQKKVEMWIAGQLAETTATEAQEATRAATEATAAAASQATRLAAHTVTILSDASEVFGGVFAFLAPFMGPAAAGPAAASMAQVLSVGAVGLDVGAWEIPGDMFARIHKGETVVPRDFATGLRDAMSGGQPIGGGGQGGTFNFKIQAVDNRGFEDLLRRKRVGLVRGMKGAVRDGGYATRMSYR